MVHVFDVNDHVSLSSAIGDLYNIQRIYGDARIDRAIHYVRTKSFRRTVARRDAAQASDLWVKVHMTSLLNIKFLVG